LGCVPWHNEACRGCGSGQPAHPSRGSGRTTPGGPHGLADVL